jgi:hypothetical protein
MSDQEEKGKIIPFRRPDDVYPPAGYNDDDLQGATCGWVVWGGLLVAVLLLCAALLLAGLLPF